MHGPHAASTSRYASYLDLLSQLEKPVGRVEDFRRRGFLQKAPDYYLLTTSECPSAEHLTTALFDNTTENAFPFPLPGTRRGSNLLEISRLRGSG